MPDISVSSGATVRILNDQQVSRIADPDDLLRKAIIDVADQPIRLAPGDEEEQTRHGLPVPAGATLTNFDPQGNEIYAFGDGSGASTVHVHLVTPRTFNIGDAEV